jgi:hypothetical protein
MTIERRNPLPKGIYWQDVFEPKWPALDAWLTANRSTVRVRTTQRFEANAGGPARQFLVFEVSAPTKWPATELGFPTIASSADITSADTVQRPPPEPDFADTITNPLGSVSSGIFWAGAVALVALGAVALAKR